MCVGMLSSTQHLATFLYSAYIAAGSPALGLPVGGACHSGWRGSTVVPSVLKDEWACWRCIALLIARLIAIRCVVYLSS